MLDGLLRGLRRGRRVAELEADLCIPGPDADRRERREVDAELELTLYARGYDLEIEVERHGGRLDASRPLDLAVDGVRVGTMRLSRRNRLRFRRDERDGPLGFDPALGQDVSLGQDGVVLLTGRMKRD